MDGKAFSKRSQGEMESCTHMGARNWPEEQSPHLPIPWFLPPCLPCFLWPPISLPASTPGHPPAILPAAARAFDNAPGPEAERKPIIKTTSPCSPAEEKLPAVGNQRQAFDFSLPTFWLPGEKKAFVPYPRQKLSGQRWSRGPGKRL